MKKVLITLTLLAIIAGGCKPGSRNSAAETAIDTAAEILDTSHLLLLETETTVADSQSWKEQTVSEIPAVRISHADLEQFDFSRILMDSRTDYLGYIGNDYRRLHIRFTSVQKKSPVKYVVTGYSEVRNNRCDFGGMVEIEELYEMEEPDFGVDNWAEDKIKRQGFIVADVTLFEKLEQKHSGTFDGVLITKWYINTDGELLYDDIRDDSDRYANNQFLGIWTNYETTASKPCAWGHYRIPYSDDLDIGAAEFSVNPKYLNNGWNVNSPK